ncbi:transposase [Azospirillum brasilense]|uniref:transposase n=1 Tax=Azospirillum brasilense TaxID=192 RepID=UPI001FFF0F74|nr:transposase [Azospirillum brasilense]
MYRDPVRSSHGHFVKASGLRWMVVMLLVPIPWARRVWALPFLSALAPSERFARETGRRHKKLTDWARQLLLQVRRWVSDRPVIAVADSSYAAIELLRDLRAHLTVVTRRPPVRAGPTAASGHDGTAPGVGSPIAFADATLERSHHRLAARPSHRLGWR